MKREKCQYFQFYYNVKKTFFLSVLIYSNSILQFGRSSRYGCVVFKLHDTRGDNND